MKSLNQPSPRPSRGRARLHERRSRTRLVRWGAALGAVLISCTPVRSQENRSAAMQATHFEIGRHTFFDFGPPTDYYELFLVSSTASGTSIERIILTPPVNACTLPAKVEIASAPLSEPIAELLGATADPCTIPEKELHRELKRCKKCLVYSGAKVVMQVQCGDHTRLIRSDILDRDMFDPAANTPEHTSWTMRLMARLDQAVGPGVMDKPMFAIPSGDSPPPVDSNLPLFQDLRAGKYDALFPDAPDKASDLYRAAQNRPPPPTVRLLRSEPVAPKTFVPPKYPPIAMLASAEGVVSFKFDIDPDGAATNLIFESGPELFRGVVKYAVASWSFSKGDAGQQVHASIEFKLNCVTRSN